MKLANFPKTFGIEELAKGYFPHLFNKKENESYIGPIPPAPYYKPNGMNPKDRETFMAWHTTKKESNYVEIWECDVNWELNNDEKFLCTYWIKILSKSHSIADQIFTCPVLSHIIIPGFAFKRDKSAVALERMVLGMGSTTSA